MARKWKAKNGGRARLNDRKDRRGRRKKSSAHQWIHSLEPKAEPARGRVSEPPIGPYWPMSTPGHMSSFESIGACGWVLRPGHCFNLNSNSSWFNGDLNFNCTINYSRRKVDLGDYWNKDNQKGSNTLRETSLKQKKSVTSKACIGACSVQTSKQREWSKERKEGMMQVRVASLARPLAALTEAGFSSLHANYSFSN